MSQKLVSKKEFVIHNYDYKIKNTYSLIERELSPYNIEIIKKYDSELVKQSLAKATRLKHLQILLNLSRFIKKNWNEVTKDDIDRTYRNYMQKMKEMELVREIGKGRWKKYEMVI